MKDKLIKIFERSDKEYLTFSHIKKILKINKKDSNYDQKCHELNEALNELVASGYLQMDCNNRFYKGSIPNKVALCDQILELLQKKSIISLNDLTMHFKDITSDELSTVLHKLELDGKIYNVSPNHYTSFPSNFFITKIYCNKKGFKYIHHKGKTIFLPSEYADSYLPYDTVVFAQKNQSIVPQKVLKRENPEVICEIIESDGKKKIKLVGNNTFPIYLSLKNLLEQDLSLSDLPIGTRILVNVSTEEFNGKYSAEFIEIMGHKDDLDAELIAIGYNNGFCIRYSAEELAQVENTPTKVSEEDLQNRVDFRNETIFTIDGEHTKDMDDAVGLKKLPNGNYLLNVSIAAVSYYIKPGSPLWMRAEKNTTSLYLIDSVSHMLHSQISNGICSLNPNVDRLAKSFLIEIDKIGNIVDFQVVDSVINSKKKMSYEKVNQLLEQNEIPESYEPFIADLLLMQELSTIISERRRKNGAIDFDSSEIKFILDDNKNIADVEVTKQGMAERIIENFMIITNEGMAEYMLRQGLTFIYRNHEIPFKEKLNETFSLIKNIGYRFEAAKNTDDPHVIQKVIQSLSSKEEFFILSSLILRSMQKAYYSTENHGHYGLALRAYSQTTSPIRRFLDLVIQTILDNIDYFYDPNTDITEIKEYLSRVCEHASIMERNEDKAEYEANKLYMIDYILQRKDEEFDAYVCDITPRYMIVKTPKLIEGIVYFDDIDDGKFEYSPQNKWLSSKTSDCRIIIGSKLRVHVKDCDRENRIIYFYALSPNKIQTDILKRTKEN